MKKAVATSTLVWVIFALITLLVIMTILIQAKAQGGNVIKNFFDALFS